MLSRYQLQSLALTSRAYAEAGISSRKELQNYIHGFDSALKATSLDERAMEEIKDKNIKYQMYKAWLDNVELLPPFEY